MPTPTLQTTCRSCGRYFDNEDRARCDSCGYCRECCSCYHCESCGEAYSGDDYCSCDRCPSCCTCAAAHLRRRDPHTPTFHGDPSRRYPRYMGVEIECGSSQATPNFRDLNAIVERWNAGVHDDGSVRTRNGMEIVTAPARGAAFIQQITEITEELARQGGVVDSSCGLHVHVDVRDLTTPETLKFLRLWRKVEAGMYEIVAPSRRSNHFAQPWGTHFADAGVFAKTGPVARSRAFDIALYGTEQAAADIKRRPYKHSGVRYRGVNLNAIVLHGTIEFRLHHGTVNRQKILMWGAVCGRLVEYAKRTPEAAIARLSAQTSFETLCEVVKDREVVEWMRARREYFRNRALRASGQPVVGEAQAAEASEG